MSDSTVSKVFTVDDTIPPCVFRPRFVPRGTIDANGNFSIEFIDTAPDSVAERLRTVLAPPFHWDSLAEVELSSTKE